MKKAILIICILIVSICLMSPRKTVVQLFNFINKDKIIAKQNAEHKAEIIRKLNQAKETFLIDSAHANGELLIKRLYKKTDDFSEYSTYKGSNFDWGIYSNYIEASISISDKYTFAFLTLSYTAEDWLFANKIKLLADKETFQITPRKWHRVNTAYKIAEYCTVSIDPNSEFLHFLKHLSKAQKAKIRFIGSDYYNDIVVLKKQKQDLSKVLAAFEALTYDVENAKEELHNTMKIPN